MKRALLIRSTLAVLLLAAVRATYPTGIIPAPAASSPSPAHSSSPAMSEDCPAPPITLPSVYSGVRLPKRLDSLDELAAFEQAANKKASIVMWSQGWGLRDGTQNFQAAWMDSVRAHGSIPMVTWEPWLFDDPAGTNQPDYRLRRIIDGSFDAYIRKWADDSRAWGQPFFLRFAPEMNGNWFPWSEQVNGNRAGQFVQAWRRVHDIFTSRGVANVTWVWSPNIEYNGSTPLARLYPGDAYVDWLGMDGYNWGTVAHPDGSVTGWQTFSQVFSRTYRRLTALSPHKPLMVAEIGSAEQGGDKAGWILDSYCTQLPGDFERIKAVVWFNLDKETDWRIESSVAAQSAFAAAVQSGFYATNAYSSLSQSPIPIP